MGGESICCALLCVHDKLTPSPRYRPPGRKTPKLTPTSQRVQQPRGVGRLIEARPSSTRLRRPCSQRVVLEQVGNGKSFRNHTRNTTNPDLLLCRVKKALPVDRGGGGGAVSFSFILKL